MAAGEIATGRANDFNVTAEGHRDKQQPRGN